MARGDPDWLDSRVKGGLSTGEGLIYNVRDPIPGKIKNGKKADDDPGEPDKRLLCVETEYATVFTRVAQAGSTLGPVLRQAFDGQDLSTMAKGDPNKSTRPHASVVGYITPEELRLKLTGADAVSSSGNRYLMIGTTLSNLLPFGGTRPAGLLEAAQATLRAALAFAKTPGASRSPTRRAGCGSRATGVSLDPIPVGGCRLQRSSPSRRESTHGREARPVPPDDLWRIPDALWERMEPLLPAYVPPPHPLGCHRARVPDRRAMDGSRSCCEPAASGTPST